MSFFCFKIFKEYVFNRKLNGNISDEEMEEIFRMLDSDGDGLITKEELTQSSVKVAEDFSEGKEDDMLK